ncbi:MAG: S41 family peptidase [Chitinophagaceae bacterium]
MKLILQITLPALFLFFSESSFTQETTPLRTGDTAIIYTLVKGKKKIFTLQLLKQQTYEIHAEQKGIDISVTLKKGGNIVAYHDSTNGSYGPEIITYTPAANESYTLEIERLEEQGNADTGRFSIAIRKTITIDSNTYITAPFTPQQMKADLAVFRAIRDSANSGLYRYRTKQQIDSIYQWANTQISKPLPPLAFYRLIVLLTDFEGSCHNWTGLPYDIKYYLPRNKGFFPYNLKYIEGNIIVNNTGGQIPPGSRIKGINGIADSVVLQRLYKYRTTDGYNITEKQYASVQVRFGIKYQVEFGIKDSFTIQYSLPNSTQLLTAKLKSISMDEDKINYLQRHSAPFDSLVGDINDVQDKYSFKQVNDSVALFTIRSFTMANGDGDPAYKVYCHFLDSIFVWMNEGNRIKHLIIDVRNNPGGSDPNFEKTFSYLANQPFKENSFAYILFNHLPLPQYYDWYSEDKENQQGDQRRIENNLQNGFPVFKDGKYFQDQKYNPLWYPDNDRFKGNIYLLTNDFVASAASHFASLIKSYSDATIIGEETAGGYYGHNGHIPIQYILPNTKMKTEFSIVFVEQDARTLSTQAVGQGIMPDFEVRQSFNDFMSNADTKMKFVLQLIQNNKTAVNKNIAGSR